MILFLDFDGVLHDADVFFVPVRGVQLDEDDQRWASDDGTYLVRCSDRLFAKAELLSTALDQVDFEIRVVISSAWRARFSLERMANFLPSSLSRRVVGMTPILDGGSYQDGIRRLECETWLNMRMMRDCPWIALDDNPSLFSWMNGVPPNLVWCQQGFGESEANDLLEKIAIINTYGEDWQIGLAELQRNIE